MLGLTQPKISPLPTDLDLTGQTAVVTGATAGLGLEISKQLLQLRISTIILAVRNVSKGEACAESLRRDPVVKKQNPKAVIKVMELDVDRYDSVQAFAKRLRDQVPIVNLLVLNAGIARLKLERSPSGHERTTQVNYYSNVLLIAELLPYLQTGAEKTGSPARITWVGSRAYLSATVEQKYSALGRGHQQSGNKEGVLQYMDKEEAFLGTRRYGDSKLLCVLFMYALAERLDPAKVVVNMMCPGMVNTGMSDILPFYARPFMNAFKFFRARSVEVGAGIVLHSALVAGPESHGRFLDDTTIAEQSTYIKSAEGQEVQKRVWDETVAEMGRLTTLPAEFR
ncbi:hypothetical protein BJX64DRAFT_291568 [Aspergillus heterothallicus]